MCIIAVKRAESAPPTEKTLRIMFEKNPDGAGIAYAHAGVLHIVKGLMNIDDFLRCAKKIPQNAPAIYHCRIQTSGGVVKELTHPFLIDADIKKQRQTKVDTTTGAALAHNGIFSQFRQKELNSDTTQFVTNYIAPLKALKDKTGGSITDADIKNIIEELTDTSRVAILTADGSLATFGSYWQEDGGIKYSNSTYKKYEYKPITCNWQKFDFEKSKQDAAALKKNSKAFADLCKKYKQYGLDDIDTYELYKDGELF